MAKEILPTEGDLEAEIHGALRLAFPWLPDGSIQHQTTFSFPIGTKHITVDGKEQEAAHARADILLHWNGQPLAILELKRPSVAIDVDDDVQGLSYARVLNPQAPLVVVTNGTDCRLLETYTGKKWLPDEPSQEAFAELVRSAGLAATRNLKIAIETLMGSNPAIWAQAIRQTSAQNIDELSGAWGDSLRPFVPEFLIPRQATRAVLHRLRDGERLILVEGPPLIGKSNILRELSQQTQDADDLVTLFLEADAGRGVLQQLADSLSQALSWPIHREEARGWLLRLSNTEGPALVLAVDGVGLSRSNFSKDINDLSSQAFGSSLRIVVALDDTVADRLRRNSTGRNASAIGRRAVRVPVRPFDDQEFAEAVRVLWDRGAEIMRGGKFSPEFRLPWVLRAVMFEIVSRPQYVDKTLAASIPPFLGLDLIAHARKHLSDDEHRRLVRAMAEAVIAEAQDRSRPISLILVSIAIFVLRRRTLRRFLEYAEIEKLIELGYLRPVFYDFATSVLVVRTPELLASEAADVLAFELIQRAQSDSASAAEWLSKAAGSVPLGDIIAAQALVTAARAGSLPLNLITCLINSPPQQQSVPLGTRMAMYFPASGVMNVTFQEGGVIEVEAHGRRHMLTPEPGDEEHTTYSDFHSWLILSHLGGWRLAMEDEEGRLECIDPVVLLEVGACPIVLHRPNTDVKSQGMLIHDISNHSSIVCHKAGIVEPITLSILKFLSTEGKSAERWVEEAASRASLPLLVRIDIALRELSESARTEKSTFAHRMLNNVVRPALTSHPQLQ